MAHTTYQPLNDAIHEIRLFSLEAGAFDDDIKGRLMITSLDDPNHPTYTALSYVWGDSTIRRDILVNKLSFSITANLEIALRHAREESKTEVLWVDAICIDQNNLAERGQQVSQMRRIYRSARLVAAFLGERSESSELALDIVDKAESTGMEQLEADARMVDYDESKPWRALRDLFARPWWKRAWIAQEVAVAQSTVIVVCGRNCVPWTKFVQLHRVLLKRWYSDSSTKFSVPYLDDSFNSITLIENYKVMHSNETAAQSLSQTLSLSIGYFQATDPRDLVYALIGMAREGDKKQLKPNYVKSVGDVYTEVVRHMIVEDQHLNFLCLAGSHKQNLLPTWVADFSKTLNNRGSPILLANEFAAAGESMPCVMETEDSWHLKVEGRYVDTIDMTITLDSDKEDIENLKAFEKAATTSLTKHMSDEDARKRLHHKGALWRTLVNDKEFKAWGVPTMPASEHLGILYETLLGRARPAVDSFDPSYLKLSPGDFYKALFRPFIFNWIRVFGSGPKGNRRRFFVTRSGYLGVGPSETKEGDIISVLFGARVPFVLRTCDAGHELVGEAYIHGIMHGEMMQSKKPDQQPQFFTLA